MKLRPILLCLCALGVPLALLIVVLPITWGYGGYNFGPIAGTPYSRVYFVDASGPAARAGLRVGQRIIPATGDAYVQEDAGPVGTVVHEHVVDPDGNIKSVISFAFAPFGGAIGVQQRVNKLVNGLTALGAFVLAIVVLLRARNQRLGVRAASVLFFSGLVAMANGGALVCDNAWCAEILYQFIPATASAATLWAALWMLAIFPPNRTKLRTILAWSGIVPMAIAIMSNASQAHFIMAGRGGWFITGGTPYAYLDTFCVLIVVVAIFDAFASARGADVAPVRWLGGMWLIAFAIDVVPNIGILAHNAVVATHYFDFINAVKVFFMAFGVAYPVLRHRLVDLNILVSRATVFTVVSAIIVGIFIAAEWAIGKIFEQSFGLSHDGGSLVAELLTLGIVLVLGLSARSIHTFVEERLTRAFFRKRLEGLAAVERVAREADAATNAGELMELGVATVERALNPLGVAFYLRRGERYDYETGTVPATLPKSYRFNDGVPLRLRRWQEPFELDDYSGEHLHVLFVPMTVRGDLIGFLCCGPKPDRTAYLKDETHALAQLAHHTAIASALLPRAATAFTSGLTPAAT